MGLTPLATTAAVSYQTCARGGNYMDRLSRVRGGAVEETAGAGATVPRAIILAISSSAVLGLVELISLLFSIQASMASRLPT